MSRSADAAVLVALVTTVAAGPAAASPGPPPPEPAPRSVHANAHDVTVRAHSPRPVTTDTAAPAHPAVPRSHALSGGQRIEPDIDPRRTLLFTSGAAKMSDRDRMRLMDFARELPVGTVLDVAGHTDRIGTVHYNEQLAKDRADAAITVLREQGMRTRPWTYGESCPREVDRTEDGRDLPEARRLNRRVVVTVSAGTDPRSAQNCIR